MNRHPLWKWRKSQNPKLTQEDLGKAIGADPSTVHSWENGKRNISHEHLRALVGFVHSVDPETNAIDFFFEKTFDKRKNLE